MPSSDQVPRFARLGLERLGIDRFVQLAVIRTYLGRPAQRGDRVRQCREPSPPRQPCRDAEDAVQSNRRLTKAACLTQLEGCAREQGPCSAQRHAPEAHCERMRPRICRNSAEYSLRGKKAPYESHRRKFSPCQQLAAPLAAFRLIPPNRHPSSLMSQPNQVDVVFERVIARIERELGRALTSDERNLFEAFDRARIERELGRALTSGERNLFEAFDRAHRHFLTEALPDDTKLLMSPSAAHRAQCPVCLVDYAVDDSVVFCRPDDFPSAKCAPVSQLAKHLSETCKGHIAVWSTLQEEEGAVGCGTDRKQVPVPSPIALTEPIFTPRPRRRSAGATDRHPRQQRTPPRAPSKRRQAQPPLRAVPPKTLTFDDDK